MPYYVSSVKWFITDPLRVAAALLFESILLSAAHLDVVYYLFR